jgi:hypothetical protein
MIKQYILILTCLSFFLSVATSNAQKTERTDEKPAFLVDIHYGFGIPLGDLADRFGNHNALGATPSYMTSNGWIFGIKGRYFFGNTVTEDGMLENLLTERGFIIGNDRAPASYVLKERGWVFNAIAGKLFDFTSAPSRAGLRVDAGLGVLWHKIRIQDDSRSIIQLSDPYHKGYDRLSGGIAGIIDLSYQYMGAKERLNFRLGINYNYAVTESLRGYNYDTRMPAEEGRSDHFVSFYASFILPLYGSADPSKIYY